MFVVGLHLLVAQGPILFDSCQRSLSKIARRISQGYGVPMHSAPAENPNAVHSNVVAVLVNHRREVVGIEGRLLFSSETAIRQLVGPAVREKARRGKLFTCLEH